MDPRLERRCILPKIDNSKQPSSARHAKMVWFNMLQLPPLQMPLDKYPEPVPPDYFFDFMNCSPSSTNP